MKKILGILVLGLLLQGCVSGERILASGKIYKGMSKDNLQFALTLSNPGDDPFIPDGGSEFIASRNIEIIWGESKNQFYVFKNVSNPISSCGLIYCKIGNGILESWHISLGDARNSIKAKTEIKAETQKTSKPTKNKTINKILKIDCQLSEAPGLGLPSEDLILLKQRTKPTFKINLDSKDVIAFNYGHSNKNNVKIGTIKISDSEKIIWDKEPYKENLVIYHSWTYQKNEKKLLEEYTKTKNFETMKEILEKGKTNDFFIKNEFIYKCKLVEAQSSSSSSVSSNNDQAKRKELIDKMINEYHIVEKIEIPGTLPRVWVTSQFHLLTFSDKKTFIHLIYSYYYTKNPKYDIIKIFDNITGKSIGTYTPSLGLRIKY